MITQETSLSALLIQRIRVKDIELAEDLTRRLPNVNTLDELNNFFHQLIATYDDTTLNIRASLRTNISFDDWYCNFVTKVLPYLMRKRLPPYTDSKAEPMYQCESKSV